MGIDISKGMHTVAIVDENRNQIGTTRKHRETQSGNRHSYKREERSGNSGNRGSGGLWFPADK